MMEHVKGPSVAGNPKIKMTSATKRLVHVDHIPVRLHLLPQEDADDHEHAHDGDGEADIGDGVKVGLAFLLPRMDWSRTGLLIELLEDEQ